MTVGIDITAGTAPRTRVARQVVALAGVACFVWLMFQPRVANHFGYALPLTNGLPCRIHWNGRDYENDEQCAGMNITGREAWYARRHHTESGGACEDSGYLRGIGAWPLREVARISTLLGSSHAVFTDRPSARIATLTPTVIWVADTGCYRAYSLLGGP